MATARGDINDDDLPSPKLPTKKNDYVMVASIDFGTTFSGYAFSFKGSETDIKINKNWGDTLGFSSYKAPTSVLLNDKDQFDSFGYEAEEAFVDVDDDGDSRGYKNNLFRHFKMVLHRKEKITRKTSIASTSGYIFKALDIFAHALRYLKDHLLEQLSTELKSPPDMSLIRWVITVPAIWTEESKQFMREAAFMANIIGRKDSTQLIIAIEPEAASFFCRQLDLVPFATKVDLNFPNGTRYLVLDCGGGTNDMVVHEIVLEHKIKEVSAINGGSAGGNQVNERFILLLKEVLGSRFIEAYKQNRPDQWLSFMLKFENAKKKVHRDRKGKLRVELTYAMDDDYKEMHGESIRTALNKMKDKGVSFVSGAVMLSNEAVRSLFQATIDAIVKGVRKVFQDRKCSGIKYLFMVGGFSENGYLQTAIRQEFETFHCTVLVPSEAQLAIIKGAVLYGHHQNQVISRIARRTYGTGSADIFDPRVHDAKRNCYIDEFGIKMCGNLFSVFVEKDEEIKVGSSLEKNYSLTKQMTHVVLRIFTISRKPRKPVEYCDNSDIRQLGEIRIHAPNPEGHMVRTRVVKMTFGSTEILVEAIDEATGKTCSTTINFLSD